MKEYIIELSDNENTLSLLVKAYNLHELIRCKDCKWRGHEDDSPKWIPCLAIRTNSDWFCADGERRTNDA